MFPYATSEWLTLQGGLKHNPGLGECSAPQNTSGWAQEAGSRWGGVGEDGIWGVGLGSEAEICRAPQETSLWTQEAELKQHRS